jgi:hypothetical protein
MSIDSKPLVPSFDKRELAEFLRISVRTLDRLRTGGMLPRADLQSGQSPRWTQDTIRRWLKTHPRVKGYKSG